MRILYLSQYFPPEAGATQTRAYEMAYNWVKRGHSVTMITEFPNHPSGIIPGEYAHKLLERSEMDGIQVIRVWVKASPVKNFRNRMFFYLSFAMNAILAGLFAAQGKFDLIYATSPPLFVGGAGLILSLLKRIPLIFEVRDLWPESAVALGEISSPMVVNWATKLEELCYRRAEKIVVVTNGIYNRLTQRGISPDKLLVVPNGSNITMFRFNPDERERIRRELALEGKFIAIYAGIFGLAQGLETILDTALLIKNNPSIHFILIGDGPKKQEILALSNRYNLPNLSLLPELPRESIPGYLSAADISIIPLRKMEIFKGALPSKIFDAWACSRPVLISIDGEARELVEKIGGGVFIPPENPKIMAENILKMMDSPDELVKMGMKGLNYTIQHHSRQALAEKLITEFENI